MKIAPPGNGSKTVARTSPLADRGAIGSYVTQVRQQIVPGRVSHFDWIRITTSGFSGLLDASCAIILHPSRHHYYVNEADFSRGQFTEKAYFGTKEMVLGWDRFDEFFPPELENIERSSLGAAVLPAHGILIPNINDSRIVLFNRKGKVEEQQADPVRAERLVMDRAYQKKGSVMLVPILAGNAENAKRALAYLYSLEVDHFELPEAGYAAHLLAGAAAPALKVHFLGS